MALQGLNHAVHMELPKARSIHQKHSRSKNPSVTQPPLVALPVPPHQIMTAVTARPKAVSIPSKPVAKRNHSNSSSTSSNASVPPSIPVPNLPTPSYPSFTRNRKIRALTINSAHPSVEAHNVYLRNMSLHIVESNHANLTDFKSPPSPISPPSAGLSISPDSTIGHTPKISKRHVPSLSLPALSLPDLSSPILRDQMQEFAKQLSSAEPSPLRPTDLEASSSSTGSKSLKIKPSPEPSPKMKKEEPKAIIKPFFMFSPIAEGFGQLEQELRSFRCKELPAVPTAGTITSGSRRAPTFPPLAGSSTAARKPKSMTKQKRLSQYVRDEEDYVVNGIDKTIRQWISVDGQPPAQWSILASPVTPGELAIKSPCLNRPLATKLKEILLQKAAVPEASSAICESAPEVVEDSPLVPLNTNRLSLFLQKELSTFDNDTTSDLELTTIMHQPVSLLATSEEDASTPGSNDTFVSAWSSTMTGATGTDLTVASSLSSCSCPCVCDKALEALVASPVALSFFSLVSSPRSHAPTAAESAALAEGSDTDSFSGYPDSVDSEPTVENLAQQFESAQAEARNSNTTLNATGSTGPIEAKEVKQSHGIVWVGEAVPNYYLTTPVQSHFSGIPLMPVSVKALASLKQAQQVQIKPQAQTQAQTQTQTQLQTQTQSLGRTKTVKAFKSLKFKNLNLRKQSEPQDLTKDIIHEDEPTLTMTVPAPVLLSEAEAATADAVTAGAGPDADAAKVRVIPNQDSLLSRVYYDFEADDDDYDDDYNGVLAGHDDDEFQITKYSSLRPRMMKLSK